MGPLLCLIKVHSRAFAGFYDSITICRLYGSTVVNTAASQEERFKSNLVSLCMEFVCDELATGNLPFDLLSDNEKRCKENLMIDASSLNYRNNSH